MDHESAGHAGTVQDGGGRALGQTLPLPHSCTNNDDGDRFMKIQNQIDFEHQRSEKCDGVSSQRPGHSCVEPVKSTETQFELQPDVIAQVAVDRYGVVDDGDMPGCPNSITDADPDCYTGGDCYTGAPEEAANRHLSNNTNPDVDQAPPEQPGAQQVHANVQSKHASLSGNFPCGPMGHAYASKHPQLPSHPDSPLMQPAHATPSSVTAQPQYENSQSTIPSTQSSHSQLEQRLANAVHPSAATHPTSLSHSLPAAQTADDPSRMCPTDRFPQPGPSSGQAIELPPAPGGAVVDPGKDTCESPVAAEEGQVGCYGHGQLNGNIQDGVVLPRLDSAVLHAPEDWSRPATPMPDSPHSEDRYAAASGDRQAVDAHSTASSGSPPVLHVRPSTPAPESLPTSPIASDSTDSGGSPRDPATHQTLNAQRWHSIPAVITADASRVSEARARAPYPAEAAHMHGGGSASGEWHASMRPPGGGDGRFDPSAAAPNHAPLMSGVVAAPQLSTGSAAPPAARSQPHMETVAGERARAHGRGCHDAGAEFAFDRVPTRADAPPGSTDSAARGAWPVGAWAGGPAAGAHSERRTSSVLQSASASWPTFPSPLQQRQPSATRAAGSQDGLQWARGDGAATVGDPAVPHAEGQGAPADSVILDPELLQQRVAALEAVVRVQEEQLLAAAQQEGGAARPEVATLLPRWRQEALRQYEQRLQAQLSAKEAVAACGRLRAAAHAEVQSAREAIAAAERTAQDAQQRAALAHEQARAAAAAESAARALVDDASGRATAAVRETRRMHDATVACMEGMRVVEGILGHALDKAASHMLRVEFAGERLTFATKLWSAQSQNRLSIQPTSQSPSPSPGSDRPTRPLLLHGPSATAASHSPLRHSSERDSGDGGIRHAAVTTMALGSSTAEVVAGGLPAQQMQRQVATLRQDRDALLAAMRQLRTTFARQVRSREAAATAAERARAEDEEAQRRRDDEWRHDEVRSAAQHTLRQALRRAAGDTQRQVLAAQSTLSARLAELEPRLWAAEDSVTTVARHLQRERHDHKLAQEQLQRKAQATKALQGECVQWQVAATEAAATAAAAEHGRAEAAAECARLRRAAADAAADAQRHHAELEELEEEVDRCRGEVEVAEAAAAAAVEERVAEVEEEWEHEAEGLREEAARWRAAAEEAAKNAADVAGDAREKERAAFEAAEAAQRETEKARDELERMHADALAAMRQRHGDELEQLRQELEGKEREVHSARRERNALLSALRDADRRAAAAGAAEAKGHSPAAGHAAAAADVAGPYRDGTASAAALASGADAVGYMFDDGSSASVHGVHAYRTHSHGVASAARSGDEAVLPHRRPLVATTNAAQFAAQTEGKAGPGQAGNRGRQAWRDAHVETVHADVNGAQDNERKEQTHARSSSQLGKRARQQSNGSGAGEGIAGCGDGAAAHVDTRVRWVATGVLHGDPAAGQPRQPWLQGAMREQAEVSAVGSGQAQPRMSMHGEAGSGVDEDSGKESGGGYGEWDNDKGSGVEVWGVHMLAQPTANSTRHSNESAAAFAASVTAGTRKPAQRAGRAAAASVTAQRAAEIPQGSAVSAHHVQHGAPRMAPAGAAGSESSESDAEEDARMLRRAARAAGVPLDLVASGGHGRTLWPAAAAHEEPRHAAPSLDGQLSAAATRPSGWCAGEAAGLPRREAAEREAPEMHKTVSSDTGVRSVNSGMQSSSARRSATASGAHSMTAARMHATVPSHSLRSPDWDPPHSPEYRPLHTSSLYAHRAQRRAQGADLSMHAPTHHGASPHAPPGIHGAEAQSFVSASTEWVPISGGSRMPMPAAAVHAAPRTADPQQSFRVIHHQPLSPALGASSAAQGRARSEVLQHAITRHAAQRAQHAGLAQDCKQPEAAPAANQDPMTRAMSARHAPGGTVSAAGDGEQHQMSVAAVVFGAGGGTMSQSPDEAGSHSSTLRDRFQVFARPDNAFTAFQNHVYDDDCTSPANAASTALTTRPRPAGDSPPHQNSRAGVSPDSTAASGFPAGAKQLPLELSLLISRGLAAPFQGLPVARANTPELAASMPTPFSSPPSTRSQRGSPTGPRTRAPSAPPSALHSPADPADLQDPRRPESIFDELSAPSLHNEASNYTHPGPHAEPPIVPPSSSAPRRASPAASTWTANALPHLRSDAARRLQSSALTAPAATVPASAAGGDSHAPARFAATGGHQYAQQPQALSNSTLADNGGPSPEATVAEGCPRDPEEDDVTELGSSGQLLRHASAASIPGRPFPLMQSHQVQSSELPASLVLPQKLARAAAVSAAAAAASSSVSRNSCELGDAGPGGPSATSAPSAVPASTAGAPAHAGLGVMSLHRSTSGSTREGRSNDAAPVHGANEPPIGMHALSSPVPLADHTAHAPCRAAAHRAAAVVPRTPLASGAARMLAQRGAVATDSGSGRGGPPGAPGTVFDFERVAEERPAGAGARRSLPFSDEDLARSRDPAPESSEEQLASAAALWPARAAAQHTPTGQPAVEGAGSGGSTQHAMVYSMGIADATDRPPEDRQNERHEQASSRGLFEAGMGTGSDGVPSITDAAAAAAVATTGGTVPPAAAGPTDTPLKWHAEGPTTGRASGAPCSGDDQTDGSHTSSLAGAAANSDASDELHSMHSVEPHQALLCMRQDDTPSPTADEELRHNAEDLVSGPCAAVAGGGRSPEGRSDSEPASEDAGCENHNVVPAPRLMHAADVSDDDDSLSSRSTEGGADELEGQLSELDGNLQQVMQRLRASWDSAHERARPAVLAVGQSSAGRQDRAGDLTATYSTPAVRVVTGDHADAAGAAGGGREEGSGVVEAVGASESDASRGERMCEDGHHDNEDVATGAGSAHVGAANAQPQASIADGAAAAEAPAAAADSEAARVAEAAAHRATSFSAMHSQHAQHVVAAQALDKRFPDAAALFSRYPLRSAPLTLPHPDISRETPRAAQHNGATSGLPRLGSAGQVMHEGFPADAGLGEAGTAAAEGDCKRGGAAVGRSPYVKGAWETQCSGLSARRRR
eukprot:jgi/Ulvmu1/12779/UM097_0006.1